jgi:hypothetical protein
MSFIPKRPTSDGDDNAARFMQWVWDWITKSGKLISVPGQIEFSYTEKGIIPRVIQRPGGSPAPPSTTVETFRLIQLVSASAETVGVGAVLKCCKMVGGESGDQSSEYTYVARPYYLRPHASRTKGGVNWTYLYNTDATFRTASAQFRPSENQVIVPYYIPPYPGYAGDLIYAAKLGKPLFQINTGTTAAPNLISVEYLDINVDGRAWAKADDT